MDLDGKNIFCVNGNRAIKIVFGGRVGGRESHIDFVVTAIIFRGIDEGRL